MEVVITEIAGDGSIRRGSAGTATRSGLADLIERAALDFPPPYEPRGGLTVYHVQAGDRTLAVSENDLAGPLRELAGEVLGAAAGATQPGSGPPESGEEPA
jgi:hypothetical protein